jgi:hypothetical protein
MFHVPLCVTGTVLEIVRIRILSLSPSPVLDSMAC